MGEIKMIGIIAAVTSNGVIGIDGQLPFDYPEDMKHFRQTTTDSTVIMGRKTFEGIGRPLPKRTNIMITSSTIPAPAHVSVARSIPEALKIADPNKNIWFIGGASIYEEGMEYADQIILTLTPDMERRTPAVKFPWVNPHKFTLSGVKRLNPDNEVSPLYILTYFKN